MPQIHFIKTTGEEIETEVPVGVNLMRGAIEAGIDEIFAECGGVASCGTCKIVLDAENLARVPAVSDIEGSMLEDDPAGYRLSCQIEVGPEMDGLVVRIAPTEF